LRGEESEDISAEDLNWKSYEEKYWESEEGAEMYSDFSNQVILGVRDGLRDAAKILREDPAFQKRYEQKLSCRLTASDADADPREGMGSMLSLASLPGMGWLASWGESQSTPILSLPASPIATFDGLSALWGTNSKGEGEGEKVAQEVETEKRDSWAKELQNFGLSQNFWDGLGLNGKSEEENAESAAQVSSRRASGE
jgi:hypothetical protein